jgi:hypothetical protein
LVDVADLTADERAAIPLWWVEAAANPGREAVVCALAQWDGVLPGLLPKFKGQIANAGIGVHVGRADTKPVLAYVVMGDAAPVCWYGYPPSAQLHHPSLDLGGLPSTLQALYTGLHDGFKQATAFEKGFPSSSELFPVSQYGSTDEFEICSDPIPNLSRLVPIFFDWAGASICVELGDADNRSGWHWSEASLRPYGDFWEMVDNWIMSMRGQS